MEATKDTSNCVASEPTPSKEQAFISEALKQNVNKPVSGEELRKVLKPEILDI